MSNDIVFEYVPQEKQKLFHFTTTDPKWFAHEVLYGGAAGGGKSAAIVGDAFAIAVKFPKVNLLILRKTLPELEGSILLTMRDWYPQAICKYNEQKKYWEFFNGSRIWLGFCEQESDVYKYQGKEYEVIYLDEATHFSETQFKYLKSRLRTKNVAFKAMGGIPQIKLTSNPGGIGHNWIKRRFIDIGEFNKVHECRIISDVTGQPLKKNGRVQNQKRIFIPARLTDNKYLDSDEYELNLLELNENTRKQLLDGSWDVIEGLFFDEFDRRVHVCNPFDIPSEWRKFRMMDEGYNDPFVCLWAAISPEGKIYIYREFAKSKLLSSEQAEITVSMTLPGEKIDYTVGDTSFWNKGKTSGEAPFEVFFKLGVPMIQATKERVNGWKKVREWLRVTTEVDPVNGETYKSSNLQIFSSCIGLIESITSMVIHKFNNEDVADHPLDHHADALRYGLMTRPSPSRKDKEINLNAYDKWQKEMEDKHFKSIMKTNKRGRW